MRAGALAGAFLALGAAAPAHAAFVVWDGGAGTTSWHDQDNWTGNQVPGASDVAALTDGSGAIAVTSDVSLAGIYGNGFLRAQIPDGVTMTITGDYAADSSHVVGGNALRVLGRLAVAGSPQLQGVLQLGDIATAEPGELDILAGAAPRATGLYVTGGSDPAVIGFSQIRIAPGATLDVGSASFVDLAGRLDLQGTLDATKGWAFLRPAAGSPEAGGDIPTAAGQVVQVTVQRGATWTMGAGGSLTGNGLLELASGSDGPIDRAVLRFAPGATFSPRRAWLYGQGALDLGTDATIGELDFSGGAGAVNGRYGTGDLTVTGTGTSNMISGTFGDSGRTVFQGALSVEPFSFNYILDGATVQTLGATAFTGGTVYLGRTGRAGGVWENAGTLTLSGNSGLLIDEDGPAGAGVLRNLASGAIERLTGGQTYTNRAQIENAGAVVVAAGAVGAADGSVDGGRLRQTGGSTTLFGTTLGMDVTLEGGTLDGSGTVRSLTNPGGLVRPASAALNFNTRSSHAGLLNVAGAFVQGPGGTLQVNIDGAAPGDYDRVVAGAASTVGGTLAIVNGAGYVPAESSTYDIVTAPAVSGQFATLTGATVGAASYVGRYTPTVAGLCFGSSCPGAPSTPPPGGGGTTTPPNGTGGTTTTVTEPAGDGGEPAPPIAPGPAAPVAPAVQQVAAATLASLPGARRCVSRRAFRIRIRKLRGTTIRKARVLVNRRPVRVLTGRRLTAPVDLRGLPKGRFTVVIEVSTADGRTLRGQRSYRTCVPKRRRGRPKL